MALQIFSEGESIVHFRIFVFIFIGITLSEAQEPLPTSGYLGTVDSAVQLAMRRHPGIQALLAEAAMARAERSETRLLPALDANFSLRTHGEERKWDLGVLGDVNSLLFYPWERGEGNLRYRSALSRLASELSAQRLEVQRAYYRAVAATLMRIQVAHESATWESAAELSRRQVAAGTLNLLDLSEMEAAAAEARLKLRSAESEVLQEREHLAKVVGAASSQWDLPESLPEPDSEDPTLPSLEILAASRNAGLAAAREERDAGERAHTLSVLRSLPTLKAGISIERDEVGRNFVGPAVAAEIPLFDLGIPKRERARAARDLGRQRLAVVEAELYPDIRATYMAMTTARQNYEEITQRLLPLREKATEEILKQYNFMLAGVYRLLEVRREEVSTQTMRVQSLRDYWIARAELEQLVGGSLEKVNPGEHK